MADGRAENPLIWATYYDSLEQLSFSDQHLGQSTFPRHSCRVRTRSKPPRQTDCQSCHRGPEQAAEPLNVASLLLKCALGWKRHVQMKRRQPIEGNVTTRVQWAWPHFWPWFAAFTGAGWRARLPEECPPKCLGGVQKGRDVPTI
jgi:hypothetical protein